MQTQWCHKIYSIRGKAVEREEGREEKKERVSVNNRSYLAHIPAMGFNILGII